MKSRRGRDVVRAWHVTVVFGATISEFEVLVQRLASAYLRFYTSTDAGQLSLLRNEVLKNQYQAGRREHLHMVLTLPPPKPLST